MVKFQMPKMGMGALLFALILVIALIIAMQKQMSHKLFFYHHSQATTEEDELKRATGDVEASNKEKMDMKNYGALDKQTAPITLAEEDAFVRCHVPSLNTQQCWESRFFQCPVINGSYTQCTNNYLPLPKYGNAPCETGRAGFEMAPPKYKISENCYYQTTGLRTLQNRVVPA